MPTVVVEDRRGRRMAELPLAAAASVADLKKAFEAKYPKFYAARQYFTYDSGVPVSAKEKDTTVRLTDNDKTLFTDYKLKDNAVLTFKDLGPQVSWTTVFLVEYFGPILVHSIFYFLPVYGDKVVAKTWKQQVGFAMIVLHYLKRELETLFVHRFSNDTMPFLNIFKNSAHYWILSGLLLAYPLYHPLYTNNIPDVVFYALVAVFLVAEFGNFSAHMTLRNLRPAGTRKRDIPRGGLFELVSCANYTWELLAWAAFSAATQLLTGWLFFAVSFGQIYLWAVKKHVRYLKEFPDYPRRRKPLVPFLC